MKEWLKSSYMDKSKKFEDPHHKIFAASLNSFPSSALYCRFAVIPLINRVESK
jgi:hypothetical protein